jgi:tetratricopeptide (TPR) repeat protein/plastocyanin/sugar lactone lactonase YvrE
LPSCKKDAEDLCELLRGLGYTIFQDGPIIASRLSKEYSWVDIKRAIANFFSSAEPGQTLLFYFSGHGIQKRDEIYLAMPDVDIGNLIVEGFSLKTLAAIMESSKSMQIVSIIDACYSGAAVLPLIRTKGMTAKEVAKETAGRAHATYDTIFDNVPKAEGRYYLLSSQAYEPSLASEDSYSLYTKYLIEGFRGAKPGINEKGLKYPGSIDDDGNVTPETLHKYVYHKVANEADQIPKIKSDMSSNIILAHYPNLAKTKLDVNSIVREGDEHFLRDEYDKAIECYDRAIEVDPNLVDAWHKKGNAFYNKENYDEAIRCYDRASLINPNHFDSWYKKGLTYKKKKNHDEALKSYDRAIEIRANRSNVWYEKGLSLAYLNKYEEAIKCYDNAIEFNPKHAEAWYWKGYAYYEMRVDDEALNCYNRAKEINPDFRNEWYGGGYPPSPSSSSPLKRFSEPSPPSSPLQPVIEQPPSSTTNKVKWPIIIVIVAVATAAVGLLLAFAGGNNILSPGNNPSPPIAVAGTDRTVNAGSLVELDGGSSRDPDNNDMITSYRWEQISGSPEIRLNNPNSASPSFSPPNATSDTRFTFRLTVTDERGQSAEDNVEITVRPVSSPATPPTPTNLVPVANNKAVTTNHDTPVKITLSASDADNDALEFTIGSFPSHGSLSGFDTATNGVTYTPNQGYVGKDSFTFKVSDSKGSVSNTATVSIAIMPPPNSVPTVPGEAADIETNEDTPIPITLTANDADNDALAFSIVSNPSHGTLSGIGPNQVYTPQQNYTGPDIFTYNVNDGKADSYTAIIRINVRAVNGSPIANAAGTTSISIVSGSSLLTTDAYQPNPIQASTGARVTWTNDDSQPHTATSGEDATPDGTFDSGIMAPGAIFGHTFTAAGEYPYFCLLHPNMVGTVSVSTATTMQNSPPLPEQSITTPIQYSFLRAWGSEGSAEGQFNGSRGIAVDSQSDVYVVEFYNYRIQKFDSNGEFITEWGSRGRDEGQFSDPDGIAVDSQSDVYVADAGNNRIQKFDSNGEFITEWGSYGSAEGEFFRPQGIAVDSQSDVYVADSLNDRIQKFDSNGEFITEWGSEGSAEGQFNGPDGIAVDSQDNVYVVEFYNNRIQKFDSNGEFITEWGSEGSAEGQFNGSQGIAVDSQDNVYVADTFNYRIQKFDSNGEFITEWGSRGRDEGQFDRPFGIAIGLQGYAYVVDWLNRVQVWAPGGTP